MAGGRGGRCLSPALAATTCWQEYIRWDINVVHVTQEAELYLYLFIAAHALSLDMTLVTNNEREFSRVRGLKLENWTR
jgi:hypothetical protein